MNMKMLPAGPEETVRRIENEELSGAIRERIDEICRSEPEEPDGNVIPCEIIVRYRSSKGSPDNPPQPDSNVSSRNVSLDGHRDRVRKRFSETGLAGFSSHEILEILLFYVIPRRDTKQTGRELIEKFGSLSGVLDADTEELTAVPFVTKRAARLFHLIRELFRFKRCEWEYVSDSYENMSAIKSLFSSEIKGCSTGRLYIACFDSSLQLMSMTDLPHPEEYFIVSDVRRVTAHLVGSGCAMTATARSCPHYCTLTREDMAFAESLGRICRMLDIEYIDHMIYSGEGSFSMRCGINWDRITGK